MPTRRPALRNGNPEWCDARRTRLTGQGLVA
jgi:hypothetical protein